MSLKIFIFWLLNIVTETAGQLSFKTGAITEDHHSGLGYFLKILRNRWIVVGICCYVIEIFLWLSFLSLVSLSNAFLLCSFNIVVISFAGKYFFRETMTRYKFAGITLITAGIIVVGFNI
jgi:drug/metabolite transporter (DMT)-like permease